MAAWQVHLQLLRVALALKGLNFLPGKGCASMEQLDLKTNDTAGKSGLLPSPAELAGSGTFHIVASWESARLQGL